MKFNVIERIPDISSEELESFDTEKEAIDYIESLKDDGGYDLDGIIEQGGSIFIDYD